MKLLSKTFDDSVRLGNNDMRSKPYPEASGLVALIETPKGKITLR